MPENQFEKNNQELNKSNKTQAEINKKIKEGASLSKSMQDTLKNQAETLGQSEKTLKGMNSATKALNTEYKKLGKESKAESKEGARQYKRRFKLNALFQKQVGFAHKSADVAKMASDSLGAQNAYQKTFQLSLAMTREKFQANQNAALETVNTLNDMREASKGITHEQLKRAALTNQLLDMDAMLVENAGKIYQRTARSGKVTKTFSQGYKDLVDSSMGVRKAAIDTAVAYDDIGKDTFQAVSVDAERAKIQEKIASIGRRYFGANKAFGEDLQKQYEAQLDNLDATEKQNERMKTLNAQTKAAAGFITGPFEKLDGILRALPAGDLISEVVGVNSAMDDFSESVRTNITAALDAKNFGNSEQAVEAIGTAGMEAAKKLMTGFGQVFKLIMSNPVFMLTAAFIASAGALSMIFDGVLETRKELGLTFMEAGRLQSTVNLTAMQFKLLGVTGEDVKGITDGIRQNLGGTTQPSAELVKGFTNLVATTGISGENVTKLATQMMAVGSSSQEAVMSQIESVAALARANDVAPGDVLNDIASDSDLFAGFAKDGGRNLAMAAITAKKLGLEMATVSKITDSLLNFEESVNAQMEAQVLTGRNINTDKARELALAGDLDGMQREITSQIGSAAEFEAMNVVQRRALADAFGVSVGELGKMITNQDKLNNMTEGEKKSRDLIAGIMKFIGGSMASLLSLAKAMIPAFVALGAVIAVTFYPVTLTIAGVIALGKAVELLNTKFDYAGTVLATIVGLATAFALKMKLAGSNIGGGLMKSLGGLKNKLTGMLGGGAAGPLTKAGKPDMRFKANQVSGVDELGKKGPGVGKGMKSLAKGVGAFANPKVIAGLAALTVALIGMGFALKLAAPGIKAFGEAMGTIIKSVATGISTIIGAIGDFAVKIMTIASPTMALGLFATAAGFTALAGSMAMFAGAGLLALPALLALTAFNAVTGAGGGGEEDNKIEQLLTEQNQKLDMMNNQLKTIKSNTKRGADEAKGFSDLVTFA